GIPDGDTTRAMFDEALGESLRMWRETPYGYEGRFFSMPPRNVLPKPWTRPHPPLWMACGSASTFEKAARLGVGALCFSLGTPRDFAPLIRTYKDTIRHAEPVGAYVNDNVACVTQLVCMEDRRKARAAAMTMGSSYHASRGRRGHRVRDGARAGAGDRVRLCARGGGRRPRGAHGGGARGGRGRGARPRPARARRPDRRGAPRGLPPARRRGARRARAHRRARQQRLPLRALRAGGGGEHGGLAAHLRR